MNTSTCTIPDCKRPVVARGLCRKHYTRQWRGNDVNAKTVYDLSPKERFWAKVNKANPDDCWEWQASKNPDGYGNFVHNGYNTGAHRVAYYLTNGKIPEGKEVCHACDNPSCVNPIHLWLGTHTDNIHDMHNKGRARPNAPKGTQSPNAKLTEAQVRQLRKDKESGATYDELALRYGVHRGYAQLIVARKRWAHID